MRTKTSKEQEPLNDIYAVITVIYDDFAFESIPLDLEDPVNSELIHKISEEGTSKLTMLKFPTTETKFVVISREQLDSCIIEIEIIEIPSEPVKEPVKRTRSKK